MKEPGKVFWMEVGPELADRWLELNTSNRKLKERNVLKISKDIGNNAWHPTGDCITIEVGSNGWEDYKRLLNGQHRCAAVVKADKSVWAYVLKVPEGALNREAIDTGATRSIADQLEVVYQIPNARKAGSAANAFYKLKMKTPNPTPPTVHDDKHLLDTYGEEISWSLAVTGVKSCRWLNKAPVQGALAFVKAKYPMQADEFAESLKDGVGLSRTSPVLQLRNYLIGTPRTSATSDFYLMVTILKSFDAFLHSKEMKMVRATTDEQAVARTIDIFNTKR